MKRRHFEALRPICPGCRATGEYPLVLATVLRESDADVIEGVLHCTNVACQREYPILDGIPLLVPGLRKYVADNMFLLTGRDDLSGTMESILWDCCGPGTYFDACRQHLSTYAWDHYGDLDPAEAQAELRPGTILDVLTKGLALAGDAPDAPVIDLGCSVGRTTFALAERHANRLVLGIDLNFSMLKLASLVMQRGVVSYGRRRVGMVYDPRVFPAVFPGSERVDFWVCDAMALPFSSGTFGLASALNVADCVPSPRDFLAGVGDVLVPDGRAVLATPYDWTPTVTPVETWLGGHSQRGPGGGSSEAVLRALLTPGAHPASLTNLELLADEAHVPWNVRMHDRSIMRYDVHVTAARRPL